MAMEKKAQILDASSAAVVVLLIIVVIVIYIMVIPPEFRQELLTNESSEENKTTLTEDESSLLEEHPGRVDYLSDTGFEHDIPALYLRKTTNSVEIKRINPFVVRSAVFDRTTKTVTFAVEDLANTKNVVLAFQVPVRKGTLLIALNGHEIFEAAIRSYNVEPVSLPREYLLDENTLEFSVSDIGWDFWSKNEYSFENMRIIADVTDVSRQQSQNVFYVSSVEYNNVERSLLKFSPECNPQSVGRLDIYINSRPVFSGIPDCGILNVHEFPPDIFLRGSNNVIFKTDAGEYLIDLVTIQTELEDVPALTYYFNINKTIYRDITKDLYNVNLSMDFTDAGDVKEARLVINGFETGLYTKAAKYSRIIDAYVKEGNNALKVEPKTTLDIVELAVRLQ
ncbi:MAG: hypothetical protein ABIG95_04265 [Candidatus Woesearchaeota archaeon]